MCITPMTLQSSWKVVLHAQDLPGLPKLLQSISVKDSIDSLFVYSTVQVRPRSDVCFQH